MRRQNIFFEGEKEGILKRLRKDMAEAAREERFEVAAKIRNQLFSLEHIKDIAMLKREDDDVDMIHKTDAPIAFLGRIEGYDISHVHGTAIVASMVVFEGGQPAKAEYRRFRMKTVEGSNDVASMREALMRRFRHDWPKPDVLLIDGGLAQVHAVEQVLHELSIQIPVIGMVKENVIGREKWPGWRSANLPDIPLSRLE